MKKNSIAIISMTNWIGSCNNNINRNGIDDDDDYGDEERAWYCVCCPVIRKYFNNIYLLPGTYRIFTIILYAVIVFH